MMLISCEPLDNFATLDRDEIPAAHSDTGNLGQAYNKVRKKLLNVSCVQGESRIQGNEIGDLEYKRDMKFDSVIDTLNGDLSIDVKFPTIAAGASAKIALSQSSDDMSETHTFFWKGINRKSVFVPGTAKPSSQGEKYIENYNEVLSEKCGDEYIAEIQYGATLLGTLRIDFMNKVDKNNFGGSLKIGLTSGVLAVEGSLDKVDEKVKKRSKVSVIVKQFGGDSTGLLTVIPDNILVCSLDDLQPCIDTLKQLVQYAQGPFKNSLMSPKEDQSQWNVIKYVTQRYDESGLEELVPVDPPAPIGLDTINKRAELEKGYISELLFKERATRLLNNNSTFMRPDQVKKVEELKAKSEINVRVFGMGQQVCYDQPRNCITNWESLKNQLKSYDSGILNIIVEPVKPKKPAATAIGSVKIWEHHSGGAASGKTFTINFDNPDAFVNFEPNKVYNFADHNFQDDIASGFKSNLMSGWHLRVYEHRDGKGKCWMIKDKKDEIFNFKWFNDKASSFRLEKSGDYPAGC